MEQHESIGTTHPHSWICVVNFCLLLLASILIPVGLLCRSLDDDFNARMADLIRDQRATCVFEEVSDTKECSYRADTCVLNESESKRRLQGDINWLQDCTGIQYKQIGRAADRCGEDTEFVYWSEECPDEKIEAEKPLTCYIKNCESKSLSFTPPGETRPGGGEIIFFVWGGIFGCSCVVGTCYFISLRLRNALEVHDPPERDEEECGGGREEERMERARELSDT